MLAGEGLQIIESLIKCGQGGPTAVALAATDFEDARAGWDSPYITNDVCPEGEGWSDHGAMNWSWDEEFCEVGVLECLSGHFLRRYGLVKTWCGFESTSRVKSTNARAYERWQWVAS